LLDCGASFGENYGPIVVASKPLRKEELAGKRIAVPGLKTTAYLTLKLFQPDFEAVVMPFDKILDGVKADTVDAGLLIHEGQLLFPKLGLHRVIDLGVWWHEKTNLPLPLGGNAVRRALGPQLGRQIARTIRDSVEYGLEQAKKPSITPCNSPATWKPIPPTNLSPCTSTGGPSATAIVASEPSPN